MATSLTASQQALLKTPEQAVEAGVGLQQPVSGVGSGGAPPPPPKDGPVVATVAAPALFNFEFVAQ